MPHEIQGLLRLDGSEFLTAAYLLLLLRMPDPPGLRDYLRQLESGASKLQILRSLARSAEARAQGTGLPGLQRELWIARLRWIPLVGPALRRRFAASGADPALTAAVQVDRAHADR